MKNYDVLISEQGKDGKKYWTRLGVGFPGSKGGRPYISCKLGSLPIDGTFVLMEREERSERDERSGPATPVPAAGYVPKGQRK